MAAAGMDSSAEPAEAVAEPVAGAGGAAPDPAILLTRLQRLVSRDPKNSFGVSGVVFAVADRAGAQTIVSLGEDAAGSPVTNDSLLPIASASKLACGLLILRLLDKGMLQLDAALKDYLPYARSARTPGVTIRRLLCHTSGLPLEIAHDLSAIPGTVRYQPGLNWPGKLAEACLDTEIVAQPGTMVQYSNVAYGLLGLVAEEVTRTSYARLLDQLVFGPLGIEAYADVLPPRLVMKVADIPSPYSGTDQEPYNSTTSRMLGAPWCSVTTNAAGLLALVRGYSAETPILSSNTAQMARADQTEGLSGGFGTTEAFLGHGPSRRITWTPCAWGLSVELQGSKEPHWAPASLPNSFGQVGSSGCLAWHDPENGVSWSILGARTTESGWILRHGARIAQAALAAATNPTR